LEKAQAEKERFRKLYEKSEYDVGNLNDEIQEVSLKHSAELRAVKANLEVRFFA